MSLLPAYQLPQGAASTIAAAGTTQGTSAQLTSNTYQAITSGSGGVAWPAVFQTGQPITLVNETSLAINIYPSQASSSVVIDAIAVNTPYILPAAKSVVITALSGTQLYSSNLSDLLPETSVTVASATSTPIGNSGSRYVKVSGTTTITSFDTVDNGITRQVEFTGILTLTYNATNLILPSKANITTAVGDTAIFKSEGSGNWRCLVYQPINGQALVVPASGFTYATVAAAGTTQGTATLVSTSFAAVTSGTGGVVLSGGVTTQVSNQLIIAITVYPPSGGAINGGSANAGITLNPGGSLIFNSTSSVNSSTISGADTASTPWTPFSPTTAALGTLSNVLCQWRRMGSNMEIDAAFTTGTETSSTGSMTIPGSFSTPTLAQTLSVGQTISNGNSGVTAVIATSAASVINWSNQSGFPAAATGGNAFNANSASGFFASVPINGWTNNN